MNFTTLLSGIKKDIGSFNHEDVTSMRFDMRAHGGTQTMYATVTLANGKTFEGWTDGAAATKAAKALKTDAKALKEANDAIDTGIPLSELQPEGVVAGEPVNSKDGDYLPDAFHGVPGNTGMTTQKTTVVPPSSGTTETPYPTGQTLTNSKK